MKFEDLRNNIDDAYGEFLTKRGGRMAKQRALLRNFVIFAGNMRDDYISQYAAQASFFTVLSAVPFMMLVIWCLKYFIVIDVELFISQISEVFPTQVTMYLSQIVYEVFYRSQSMATLSFTIIAAIWASSRGVMAIYCGLNQINGYVKIYNWFAARLASVFYNVLFLLIIVATIIVLVFGNTTLALLGERYSSAYRILNFIIRMKTPIFFIMFVLAFAALYTFLPQRRLKFRGQLIGAAFTAVGWMLFSYIFSLYIEYVAKYSLIYGSLTAIVLLMLWTYTCIYMLLIGAEINKHINNGFFRHIKKTVFAKK